MHFNKARRHHTQYNSCTPWYELTFFPRGLQHLSQTHSAPDRQQRCRTSTLYGLAVSTTCSNTLCSIPYKRWKRFSKPYRIFRYQRKRYVRTVATALRHRPSNVGHLWYGHSTAVVRERNRNFILTPTVIFVINKESETLLDCSVKRYIYIYTYIYIL